MIPSPPLTYLGDDQWRLDADLVVHDPALAQPAFVVPAGFQTDLASIPRPLWAVIAPFELSTVAPIAHDWLYRNGGTVTWNGVRVELYDRKDADKLLRSLCLLEGVPAWRARAAYAAVRLFGSSAWQSVGA